jgi:hypothetical protein
MAEGKKNLAQLRAEVRAMMASIQVAPSKMCRADLERMKEVYGAAAEKDKSLPHPEKKHGGRTKAKEVEGAEKDGIAVPKKLVKEKTLYAEKKEKKAKAVAQPGKVIAERQSSSSDSDSDSDSDIEVIFQHKSKPAAAAPESDKSKPTPKPKPKRVLTDEQKAKMKAGREAKKQQTPQVSEPPQDKADNEMYVKLPVFRLG